MELEFRRIQGPYGKSRRYIMTIPRQYAERVLKLGYQGVAFIMVGNIAIVMPSKGYELDTLKERVAENLLYIRDLEAILTGKTSLLSRLDKILSKIEDFLRNAKSTRAFEMPSEITRQYDDVKSEYKEGDVPSFLKDNPWLEILSKRGKMLDPEYI